MARLRERKTGRSVLLDAEQILGRSDLCGVKLDGTFVSSQHAAIRWTGSSWELRDLGSRNGTFLDGAPIRTGQAYVLAQGAVIAFGQPSEAFELEDDGPPRARVVPLGGGEPLVVDRDLLALPSPGDPRATIYRAADGHWQVERLEDSILPLDNQTTFEAAGRRWQFFCPAVIAPTSTVSAPREVGTLALRFAVSRDEEHVQLEVTHDGRRYDLGDRAHNYLLLILARRRAADRANGLPATSCGWMDQEELLAGLRIPATQLNVDIFRIRRQFASDPLYLVDAAQIIERRQRAKQLRIGVDKLELTTL